MAEIVFLDAGSLGESIDLDAYFSPLGTFISYYRSPPETVVPRIREATVIITNKVPIGAAELAAAHRLQLVCVSATGTDHIDQEAITARGIPVRNVAGYSTESVAQFTFSLLFSLLHQLPKMNDFVYSGQYSQHPFFAYWPTDYFEVRGKQWGIIGLGKIGRRVAELASAFGATITYYSASGKTIHPDYESLPLEKLLATSDILSIHAPLNEQTRGLIGTAAFRQMRSHAFLINVGRGAILQEAALVQALEAGQIAGAAIDVYEHEPLPANHPYLRIKCPERLLLTPHAAWASAESRHALLEGVAANIREVLALS